MGKKKIVLVGEEPGKKEEKREAVSEKENKKEEARAAEVGSEEGKAKSKKAKKRGIRGEKYQKILASFDKEKEYSLKEAISLLVKTSIGHFDSKAEAHLVVKKTGLTAKINFPYSIGKLKKVAIADEPEIIEEIKKGKIDFDILLASPKVMPLLVPYARKLGPLGLMPNPKNGTLVENPQEAREKMEKGSVVIRTEKKFPLIHLVFGRVNQPEKELKENLRAVVKGVGRGNIKKLVICATMGPGIKVAL